MQEVEWDGPRAPAEVKVRHERRFDGPIDRSFLTAKESFLQVVGACVY
jgi:hypothetical protein